MAAVLGLLLFAGADAKPPFAPHNFKNMATGCAADCPAEVLENILNQEVLCGMEDLSCLKDCASAEYLKAHCECNTGALFGKEDFVFYGETFCEGTESCQKAVLDHYLQLAPDSTKEEVEEMLHEDCTGIAGPGGKKICRPECMPRCTKKCLAQPVVVPPPFCCPIDGCESSGVCCGEGCTGFQGEGCCEEKPPFPSPLPPPECCDVDGCVNSGVCCGEGCTGFQGEGCCEEKPPSPSPLPPPECCDVDGCVNSGVCCGEGCTGFQGEGCCAEKDFSFNFVGEITQKKHHDEAESAFSMNFAEIAQKKHHDEPESATLVDVNTEAKTDEAPEPMDEEVPRVAKSWLMAFPAAAIALVLGALALVRTFFIRASKAAQEGIKESLMDEEEMGVTVSVSNM